MSSNGRWAGFDEVRQVRFRVSSSLLTCQLTSLNRRRRHKRYEASRADDSKREPTLFPFLPLFQPHSTSTCDPLRLFPLHRNLQSVPKGCWPNTARPPPRLTPYTHTVIFPFRDLAADLLSRPLHSSRNYISRIKERANLRHFELFWSEPNRNGIARGEMIGSLSSIRAALKGLEEWVYDQGKTYTSWEQDKLGSRRWLEWRSARVQVVEGLWLKEWAADERPYSDRGAEKRSGGLDDRYGSSVGDGRTMASKADDWRDDESAARRKRRRSSIPPPAYSDDETYGRRSSTSTRSEREKPSRRRTAVKQRSSGSSTKPTTEDVRIRCEITSVVPSHCASRRERRLTLFLPAVSPPLPPFSSSPPPQSLAS